MAKSKKPGYTFKKTSIPKVAAAAPVMTKNPVVPDVIQSFRQITPYGDFLAAWDDKKIEGIRYTKVNIGKLNRAKNHMQGMQRLRTGQYVAISGGDSNEPASHVFIVKLASRSKTGAWGSNVLFDSRPPAEDKVVKVVALDDELWHSGGVAALGDVLAVPIESAEKGNSRIVFLNLNDPEKPARFPFAIERPKRKATAVALTGTPDGRFVCAVLWGSQNLDFYRSMSTSFHDGFEDGPITWKYSELIGAPDDRVPNYQAINFVTERAGASGESRLFLIALENTSPAAPHVGGQDSADLYLVEGLDRFANGAPGAGSPNITWHHRTPFYCKEEHCNMAAAAGVYVDPAGTLSVYSAYHWRIYDTIRLTEFRTLEHPETVDALTDAWIELFEHKDFEGRRLTVLGRSESKIEDYDKVRVQGGSFNDKVSSVRFQIPAGQVYRLYKDARFRGDKPGKDYIDLEGTGKVETISDLAQMNFGDKVSSSRYVKIA
ncbi:MAG TPA: hypothetical protein VLC48_04585 [Gemmatimonadota bacterium]|nr:hypothetical protein [Gemmatimonadota bacterium]